jgi:hypothetical protein
MRSRGGAFLLLLVIVIIGFSFYRGYLTLTSDKQPATNNTEIKLIVDQDKIKTDTDRAGEEVKKATSNIDLNPSS